MSAACRLDHSRLKKPKTSLHFFNIETDKTYHVMVHSKHSNMTTLLATTESQHLHLQGKQHGLTTTHRSREVIKGFVKTDTLVFSHKKDLLPLQKN